MSRKTKRPSKQPATPSWEFDPDIPTYDFFEGNSLDELGMLQEAVDGFVYWLEEDRFLTWEAVACEEQGLRLTARQKGLLGELLCFGDDVSDEILYIDEVPRFSEPWHVILNKIVPHLLLEPYRTFDVHEDVTCDGWTRIVSALREHGEGLSLPPGVESCEEVVPVDLRHKLWLQSCFDNLGGLGQLESMTLENPQEQYRVDWFIECLRKSRASVAYFGLTLESLLGRIVLPAKDQPILLKLLQDKLGLAADDEQIAGRL
jgi:hypothetical protein